jgi:hypothetical protein
MQMTTRTSSHRLLDLADRDAEETLEALDRLEESRRAVRERLVEALGPDLTQLLVESLSREGEDVGD